MSTSTKTELLHEASRMLLAKGLNGFSLQELASKLNIKKASLFHHYPSKTALAIELYRYYQSSFEEWAKHHEHLSPERQIVAYGEKLTTWICAKQRVCPVGAMSLEWHLVPKELQGEIKKLHELHKEWLTSLFKEMKKESGIRISVNEAVVTTMGLLQGSIQLARIMDDPAIVTQKPQDAPENHEGGRMSVHEDWLKQLRVYKEEMKKLTGKDFLFPPPSNETLQVEYTEVVPGKKMAGKFPYQKKFANPVGLYQGGFLSAAVDEVLGPLAYITAGRPSMTLSLNMTYLRAFPESMGHVLIEGFVLQKTKSFIFLRAEVKSPQGDLLAHAESHVSIMRDDQLAKGM